MRRILKCDKSGYITDKIINGIRATNANVGNAATIDMFVLKNETQLSGSSGSIIEQTRGLLHFNLNPLRTLTSSILNISDPSFKCFLSLKDIYGGQTTPSNFTLVLNPLGKEFSEGRGSDIIAFRDIDATNWLTASIIGTPTLWSVSGANAGGGIDYFDTPSASFLFNRGDEDMYVDITSIVSSTLVGDLPDYGLRLAFTASQENDNTTYFVKRFSSRHVKNTLNHPQIHVFFNDSFIDNQLDLYTNINNTIAVYNHSFFGQQYQNFFSGSTQITGSNSVLLQLIASRSLTVWTSSFSPAHSATINHLTNSFVYFSASFGGSQLSIGGNNITGIYYAPVFIDSNDPSYLSYINALDWRNQGRLTDIELQTQWISGTFFLTSGSNILLKQLHGSNANNFENNFVVNVINLKPIYMQQDQARLRVFVLNYNTELQSYKVQRESNSSIFSNMHWRLIESFTKEIIIPFDFDYNSTRLSADGTGMYFDLFMEDLEPNHVYELEFIIKETNKDFMINQQGFKFKVMV